MNDTFAGSTVRHGTASGFRTHQALIERPCDACYRAKQAYDLEWRSAPKRTQQSRAAAAAQGRALKRLKNAHPEEYAALYAEEKARPVQETSGEAEHS